jgi:hypothetical protein
MRDEGPSGGPGAGQIVTFYSFKGGTGRTMALANVAWILAANGKRVLIADWDLESPGLHRFFQPFMHPEVSEKPGIVDFIRRYEWAAVDFMARDDSAPRAAMARLIGEHVSQVSDYAAPVSWRFPGEGAIDFLTPGKQGDGVYENTLSALDWDTLYDDLDGGDFFDVLRAYLKTAYDYVLIDSRTGLSDIADICTIHLPDMVVDCFTLSTQGIEGAARMAKRIQSHTLRDITILPVPMRIDHSQHASMVAGLQLAELLFDGLPAGMSQPQRERYWAEIAVPYSPPYAYEETLAAFSDRPGSADSLLPAYERLTAWITGHTVSALPPLDEWLRARTRLRFARTALPGPPEVFLDFGPQDRPWAEWIAAVLAKTGIYARLAGEEPTGAADHEALTRVVAVASEFYFSRLDARDFLFAERPELLICVTDTRIPPEWSSEVPIISLAGLSEAEAGKRLIDRLGGGWSPEHEPVTGAMRYPGGGHDPIA